MEFQHITQNVGSLETIYDGKLEQAVDGDITLPEYCPDIIRILKCTVEPSIHSAQASGERVAVEGAARVHVLYAAEDGTLQSFEQTYPFARTADIPGAEGAAVRATVKTEYANARAVSPRRLDVHGLLSIALNVLRRREDAILTQVSGGGIQALGGTVNLSSLEALHGTTFQMNEVIEVEPNLPPVDQILSRQAVVIPTEMKAIKNKLLIKGNLEVRLTYSSRGAKEPITITHIMPLSQIIEAPGVSEQTANTLRLRVNSLDITPKPDTNGAARLLDIAARVAADVKGYAPVELPVVKDAYSTQGGIALDTRRLESRELAETFRDTFTAKEGFDFGSGGIQSVQLLTGDLLPPVVAVKDDGLHANGKIKLSIVYLDGAGQIASAEKELPYSFRRAMKQGGKNLAADLDIDLLNLQETVSGDHLDVRAELAATGETTAAAAHTVVNAVSANEEEALPKRSPLTIYFASSGEPVWDIAKRYRTTVDAVRQENELASDTAAAGQMLLIPSV
ncbi:MAG: DUF3794 domain-containing protein [Oscillospiraceae bacterium]|jgi:hypothetical protein|nr:DUF3794 domain-containing protein [Oscillospiraceae bacterium]